MDPTSLLNHLAECLWKVAASTVEIQGNRVLFTRRMLRLVSNWNVLVPFERGDLTVDADTREVRYCVSIRELVLWVTGMLVVATIIILKSSAWQALLFVPLMWLWLVGGNLSLGIFRFKRFVARAIRTAPHGALNSTWTHR
ncbi:MAG: hypothetical protein ABSA27_19465 [Terriglobales bacterium]